MMDEEKIRDLLPEGFGLQRSGRRVVIYRESRRTDILALAGGRWPPRRPLARLRGRGRPLVVGAGEEKLVVRRYFHGGVFRRLTGDRFLGAARPLNELRLLESARRAGVGVPEAAGLVLEPAPPIFTRADLITVYLPRSVDLLSHYRDALPPAAGMPAVIAATARQVALLHRAGIFHGDLQLKNILVRPESRPPEVRLLDFDRGRSAPPGSRYRRRNLFRLYRSFIKMKLSLPLISRYDPVRFLRVYAPGDRAFRRDILARGRRRAARMRLHRWKWMLSFRLSGGYYARSMDKRGES